jgi:hypothetical protein
MHNLQRLQHSHVFLTRQVWIQLVAGRMQDKAGQSKVGPLLQAYYFPTGAYQLTLVKKDI